MTAHRGVCIDVQCAAQPAEDLPRGGFQGGAVLCLQRCPQQPSSLLCHSQHPWHGIPLLQPLVGKERGAYWSKYKRPMSIQNIDWYI